MNQPATSSIFVETQWLAERLYTPDLQVVEVDMSPAIHKNRHLPEAVFWHIQHDLFRPDLHPQNDPLRVKQLLADSGIAPQTTVVAYGSYPGTGSWIFCFLRLVGHDNVKVLNGGHSKWMAEGRPVVADLTTIAPRPFCEAGRHACPTVRSH